MLLKEKKKMQYHILRQVTHIMQNVIGLLMERDSNFNIKKMNQTWKAEGQNNILKCKGVK